MAKLGYFRLEHSSVNRAKSKTYPDRAYGDGYLSNKANYAANSNKCVWIHSVNMGVDRHEIRATIKANEASLSRKNAMLGDALIVSLPVEMSEEHRKQATEQFLWVITGEGRAKASAFYHNDHAHNPHIHAILIDRDDDGKPVLHLHSSRSVRASLGVERNSTTWLRQAWETECNAVLEEHGYEFRIDHRSNEELGLEAAGEHRGYTNDNQEALETPSVEASDVVDLKDIEAEDAHEGDEDMAVIQQERTADVNFAAHEIRRLHYTVTELNRLNDVKQRLQEANDRHKRAVELEERAKNAAAAHLSEKVMPAQQEAFQSAIALRSLSSANGHLKGFGISAFGFELKTKTRREAEQAQSRHAEAQHYVDYQERAQAEYSYASQLAHTTVLEAVLETATRQAQLRQMYGTDEEISQAEKMFDDTIISVIQDVPLEAALEAFERMELTEEEYITFLEQYGDDDALAEFMENRDKYVIKEVDDYEV